MDVNPENLAALVELLDGVDFTFFQLEQGDTRITISRGDLPPATSGHPASSPRERPGAEIPEPPFPTSPAAQTMASSTTDAEPTVDASGVITAPMLGTFYVAPRPGEPPFVQVGDVVAPDTVVAIIEVMKLMTPVHAGCHGVIAQVVARNNALVEFDEVLFRVRETDAS